ncbi:H-NS family nucleoid-associated regulatory protein [Alloalcanivorax xenomutans]|jgi:DNA-binding protein H-NS|uniref:H-NS histone family protein n=1 Tax=Alloalcanivorax xenomutans TaxID=1094342 RepID=A0A9Q3W2N6_9GAMM|nr:H-NS histone family protein [Alloalcanivorax xenomutans]ERS09460.1 DNA-binding protein [Alcanivorax sp. PN-3]MBA4719683.1 H-NS histone family protein [Alcanivorax sp.]ARB43984.1 DNA-binding protein [Alloalcanivorax xenomutans]MCE7507411.1 H-NS histone family protein [Alloalcanivorax xenomutans]MCE7522796.1 H-NS histone family protein [Alloalcanivorax xenomutans]|tara:strand:+ start:1906 stop:2271 length:366 start_codon:yes stop_codon:yes gene_type:complete|eukprot:gnl/TRDRNA2_/TRDRNA2_177196_c0_seq12.p1 gnl/TRDRNA2_/TRDRNA2_177196_c0~~gnl/TRDRNA2_/TRDRNA2_177196_c0_seq12.p1  ORF type:complete len:122 (-),score=28.30 gnl/TRDRNA2_/TRDRNA2_177196_c0_seq12:179-544(-)
MTINIDDLSVAELEKLIKQAERKLEKKRREAVKNAQAEIEKIAKDLGVSVEDLLDEKTTGRKKAARKTTTRKKTKAAVRKPAKIKYRNPADSSQTWTGRGKRPVWLREALEKGGKLEDYEV